MNEERQKYIDILMSDCEGDEDDYMDFLLSLSLKDLKKLSEENVTNNNQ